MPQMPLRTLHLGDVLILTAATAFGLVGCWYLFMHPGLEWFKVWNTSQLGETTRLTFFKLWSLAREGVSLVLPLLLSWSAAVLVLRLRKPRPRRRYLWCQPGFLACLAALLTYVWSFLLYWAGVIATTVEAGQQVGPIEAAAMATELFVLLGQPDLLRADAGGAVALVWLILACGGRWYSEPTWVDRAGRVLGVTWLLLIPVTSPVLFFG